MTKDERAVALALKVIQDELGIEPDRVVIAVAGRYRKYRDTTYSTHVGETWDRDKAAVISILANDLANEARKQGMALAGGERCPACDSPRLAIEHRPDRNGNPRRIEVWDSCMDCSYEKDRDAA